MASAAYAGCAYLAFLAVVGYAVLFMADAVVPLSIDGGRRASSTATAVVVDVLLLALFAVQHSIMARTGFKRWLVKALPDHLERSSYVLASSVTLALLFWQWRPIPTVLWHVDRVPARAALWTLYGAGWTWAVAMTFAIDHLDMFGLSQVARQLRGLGDRAPVFRLPWPYRLIRHPMMIGFFVAFLTAPTMSGGHLMFAVLTCSYILVGVRLEERDLTTSLPQYRGYATSTPRFIPRRINSSRR